MRATVFIAMSLMVTVVCLNSSPNFLLFLRAIDTSYPIRAVSVEAGEDQTERPARDALAVLSDKNSTSP